MGPDQRILEAELYVQDKKIRSGPRILARTRIVYQTAVAFRNSFLSLSLPRSSLRFWDPWFSRLVLAGIRERRRSGKGKTWDYISFRTDCWKWME